MEIRLRGLTVDFPSRGVRALDGIDLDVAEGEQVALLGPSGAGKSTLLRALLGGVTPSGGAVRVGGVDPSGRSGPATDVRSLRRATGVIRQGDDLVLGMSARANAVLGTTATWTVGDWWRVARGRAPRAWEARLEELADRHGVLDCLPARVAELSGGQRQRIALVRALLPDPRLLLADEPTAGLDPTTGAAAVDALLASEVTLVLATHDLQVARRFPRIVALRDGQLVHDGSSLDEPTAAAVYAGAAPRPGSAR